MTDLLDAETVTAFKDAIRDVTDIFHKYPVRLSDLGIDLVAGRKVIEDKLDERTEGGETDEVYELAFNREYLKDQGLVDEDDNLLITYDEPILMDEKIYHIRSIKETSFRDSGLMVILEVVR
jgi:hypothetical protein